MLLLLATGPMLAGIIAYILGRFNKKIRDYFADIITLLELGTLIYLAVMTLNGSSYTFSMNDLCGLGVNMKLDGFRIIYGLVAAFMWAMTTILSREYMAHYKRTDRYYLFFLFTLGATVGVFLSADLFTTFLFFEIMSFTSYVWVAHDQTKDALRAAETYLAVAVIGGMIMLLGMFFLYNIAGTLKMDELLAATRAAVEADPSVKGRLYVSGACMLFGFGAKAGMFPLHIWLPKAHPVAPAPASALLSGILTKSGIFGVLVISTQIFLHDPNWGFMILVLGTITMFGGALLGVFSVNLKRTLACSSMSQIGFILVGVGMQGLLGEENALAIRGTILHMVNHSLIKLVLFMAAGVIYMNLHELDLNKIRGFGRKKPLLMISFLVGGLSISGIPMFSGYVSKTLLHESIVEYMHELTGTGAYGTYKFIECVFLLTGGMTLAYMTKLFVAIFVEENQCKASASDHAKHESHGHDDGKYMNGQSATALSLAAAVLFILGIMPYKLMDEIAKLAIPFMNGEGFGEPVNYFGLENLKGGVISVTIGVLIYFFFIRTCLMKKDEDGNKVYINAWPQWLDIENLIYRPLIQHIIPFVLAFVLRFFDRMVDRFVWIMQNTILKEVEPKRPLMYGNMFTHVVGGSLDKISLFIDKLSHRKPVKKNFEKKLAFRTGVLIKASRLTAKSVSYGLMMFSFGCIFTLIYLLVVLVLHVG